MERSGAVAVEGMELHQAAIGASCNGIKTEQTLGIANAGPIFALVFSQADQLLQRLHHITVQLLADGQNPLIIATGQQFTLVELSNLRQDRVIGVTGLVRRSPC